MPLRPGDRQLIKEWNIALVLDTVRRLEPVARVDISRLTGLSRSTITGIITRLLREGLVEEVGSAPEGGTGRRPVLLRLGARSLGVVGVKLGPAGVTAGLTDLHADILLTAHRPLPSGAPADGVVASVAGAVREAVSRSGLEPGQVLGVGLVTPGVVDPETGTSLNSYFPHWRELPLRSRLEEQLELPVLVDNDANALALAEHRYGAGRGADQMVCVSVGVGVGAGLILQGRLYRGHHNGAGELGHTTLDSTGPRCVCGKAGCLEALVGDLALAAQAVAAMAAGTVTAIGPLAGAPDRVTREIIVDAARVGDRLARELLEQAGERLGLALAGAVNLISPARIVLSGEAALQAGDLLLEPVRRSLARWVFPPLAGVPVINGLLSTDAWVRGAAALLLDEAFRVPLHDTSDPGLTLSGRVGGA